MKLSEISVNHLTNEDVNEFLRSNDVTVHGPPGMPDYEIVDDVVAFYSQDVTIPKLNDQFSKFKFPFKFIDINYLKIAGRTLESWNNFPADGITHIYIDDCKIPSIETMPSYESIRLGVRYEFSESIIPLFDSYRIMHFSLYDPTNEYEILLVTKTGSGPIRIDRHTDRSMSFTDVFDFQTWLVDNGYERLT